MAERYRCMTCRVFVKADAKECRNCGAYNDEDSIAEPVEWITPKQKQPRPRRGGDADAHP